MGVQERAKVHQYLHWHHTNARLATINVLRPLAMQMWGKPTPEVLEMLKPESIEATLATTVGRVETFLTKPFIAYSRRPTIADYVCYCELDTIELLDLFDFSKYPKTSDWMKRMKVRQVSILRVRVPWRLVDWFSSRVRFCPWHRGDPAPRRDPRGSAPVRRQDASHGVKRSP